MKSSFGKILLTAAVLSLLTGMNTASCAITYDVTDYEGTNSSLVHHVPPYSSGDNIEILNDLTATSDMGDFGAITLTINGNEYTVSGDNAYSGFLLDSKGYDYTLNNITLSEFISQGNDIQYGTALHNNNANKLTFLNANFSNNKTISETNFARGGAIYSSGSSGVSGGPQSKISITNSTFYNNMVKSGLDNNNSDKGGGAIYNYGNSTLIIVDSVFENNMAIGANRIGGGAIFNSGKSVDSSLISIINTQFTGNSAATEKDTAYGGAIYNSTLTADSSIIADSSFIDNSAIASKNGKPVGFGRGGGVYNAISSSITINNSYFEGNLASGLNNTTGGAVDSSSNKTSVIRNTIFINNIAQAITTANGGGVFNNGNLNLIADEGILKFSGNKTRRLNDNGTVVSERSNGIHNHKRLFINASKSGMVSIEDKISGLGIDNDTTLNINQTGTSSSSTPIPDAPTKGNVVILDTVSDNIINLYDGMLSMGRTGFNIVADGNYFINANLNLLGGIFNTANSNIDNMNLVNFRADNTAKLYIDASLSDTISQSKIDNFTVTNTADGSGVVIAGINIMNDSDTSQSLRLFTGNSPDTSQVRLNAYTQLHKYVVDSVTDGELRFTVDTGTSGLTAALQDATTLYRSFSANSDENVTLAPGEMAGGDGAMVTVFGNMQNINGNRKGGLKVNANQTLKIFSAGSINSSGEIVNAINNFYKAGDADDVSGGFVQNAGTLDVFSSAFKLNKTITNTGRASGGAISNTNELAVSYGVFEGNLAQSSVEAYGGAVYNSRNASFITSTFTGNKAESASGTAKGGAIYNSGTLTLLNTSFKDNIAQGANAQGGAIYNAATGTVNLIAAKSDIVFTGNKANGISSALFNEGTINLNTGMTSHIIFDDAINGGNKDTSIININNSSHTDSSLDPMHDRPASGTIVINDKITDSTINLYGGTFVLSSGSSIDGNNMKFAGGLFNTNNGTLDIINLDNVTVNNSTRWAMDIDLENGAADRINANQVLASDGKINITSINLLSDAIKNASNIPIVSQNLGNYVELTVTRALTPIYQYRLNYDPATGMLNVGGGPDPGPEPGPPPYENFNPAILAAPIAAQIGGYLAQLNSYDEAFNNMDLYMLMTREQRAALKHRNKIADISNQPGTFSPLSTPFTNKGGWFKPYSNFENVRLKNGPKVSNVSYGSYIGVDSELKELGHGFDGIFSLYAGYNGSHQAYDGIGIYQNGGIGGASAFVYKGNFFSGLTINAGANSGEASTMYGRDHFTMLTAGIASKTGYNWEVLNSRLVIQPNYLMSYTFVDTFDYTNAAGVRVHSSPLNAIQIAPGVRIIGNLKNGWQPYLGVNMVWNIIDETKFKANDVSLPQLSVKPYVEYGVGLQRLWGERFIGFGQAMIRNGGRNGIALQLGFRFRI